MRSMLPLLALGLTTNAWGAWPADDEWDPVITPAGVVLTDPTGDQGGGQIVFDIVGNAANPAGYWFDDGTDVAVEIYEADPEA